jgi:hypothetical protein
VNYRSINFFILAIVLGSIYNFVFWFDFHLVLTLIPYYDNIHSIKIEELSHLEKSNILSNNKKEIIETLYEIDKCKTKTCKFCNESFSKITDLRKHILVKCFLDNLSKKNKLKTNEININDNNINSNNNNYNSNNTINNTVNNSNNFNISIEINQPQQPIPFDNEWDISKISNEKWSDLLISNIMYTSLLEEILKNEINLNVIIDKKSKSGYVYKNDIDKYIQMKLKDIVDSTMIKLKKHLLDINKDQINKNKFPEIITHCRRMIDKKYIDYSNNNNNIQMPVMNLISGIYQNKNDDAVKIASSINNKNNNNEIIENKNKNNDINNLSGF